MRRRSERKKSTDVSSPAPVSRRTSRRSRQTSETASEKGIHPEMSPQRDEPEKIVNDADASEETSEGAVAETGKASSRNRTPVKDRSSPAKPKLKHTTTDSKIEAIPEENSISEDPQTEGIVDKDENAVHEDVAEPDEKAADETTTTTLSPKNSVDIIKPIDVLEIQEEDPEEDKSQSQEATTKNDCTTADNVNEPENNQDGEKITNSSEEELNKQADEEVVDCTINTVNDKSDPSSPQCEDTNGEEITDVKVHKRKWITKRTVQNRSPLLVITTHTDAAAADDNNTVSAGKLNLGSSPDVQEIISEREEGEETPSPEREIQRTISNNSVEKIEKIEKTIIRTQGELSSASQRIVNKVNIKVEKRSPSPKKATNILYITNLVRPFTVLQLKGLLARTGKMVEDGFWIDRIKSKCYVQYETEDEAIETRHALHGVRWPVSNPKCLIVNFGKKSDMDRAIQSTKEEQTSFGQESHRDNVLIGMGWNRDRNGLDEKRTLRPVREWDVGKKESLDRDKSRDILKRRSREREIIFGNRVDTDRNGKERRPRSKGRGDARSSSRSPARKVKKKENDPPLRLLDDLFRKTKSTPCIYWLPLTPEQIAEKEAFRQKRLEEHKQRVKQRELEKGKEREKERTRTNDRRDRERERDQRRNRSSDRRSRSRDRRRY